MVRTQSENTAGLLKSPGARLGSVSLILLGVVSLTVWAGSKASGNPAGTCFVDSLESLLLAVITEPNDTILWNLIADEAQCLDSQDVSVYSKALVAMAYSDNSKSKALFDVARRQVKDSSRKALIAMFLAKIDHDAGNNKWVIRDLDEALSYRPDLSEAWYLKGCALANQGLLKKAITCFDSSLIQDPGKRLVWAYRGRASAESGQLDKAIRDIKQSINLKSTDPWVWVLLGMAYLGDKQYGNTLSSCDMALKLHSEYPTAWTTRAQALWGLERYDEAVTSCDSALTYLPDDAWTKDIRQRILEAIEQGMR